MAKRKTKKVEKPTRISKEELNRMQSIITNINKAQLEIGSIEHKKHTILHYIDNFQDQLNIMRDDFEKTYGTSDINIQDGTINRNKNEQIN
tara:strand:+ start:2137 stop:2409 length:273 start_codon:yes stop_codon:yes gene_type:complete